MAGGATDPARRVRVEEVTDGVVDVNLVQRFLPVGVERDAVGGAYISGRICNMVPSAMLSR